jgi:hypothetical protein
LKTNIIKAATKFIKKHQGDDISPVKAVQIANKNILTAQERAWEIRVEKRKKNIPPLDFLKTEKLPANLFSSLKKYSSVTEAPVEALLPHPNKLTERKKKIRNAVIKKLRGELITHLESVDYLDGGYEFLYTGAEMNLEELRMFAASVNHHGLTVNQK